MLGTNKVVVDVVSHPLSSANGKDYLWFSILFLKSINKSHKNRKASLTIHSKQKILILLYRELKLTDGKKFHFCQFVFYDSKLSNCPLSLVATSHKLYIHASVRLLTIKISQWDLCCYRKNMGGERNDLHIFQPSSLTRQYVSRSPLRAFGGHRVSFFLKFLAIITSS